MFELGRPWWCRYREILAWSDAVVVSWSVAATPILHREVPLAPDAEVGWSVVAAALWWFGLGLFRSRADHVIGTGSAEYGRVMVATAQLAGLAALVSILFRVDVVRQYLTVAVPIGTAMLLLTRWLWRRWLHILRRRGDWFSRVFVVGGGLQNERLAAQLVRLPWAGYDVVGTWAVEDRDWECPTTTSRSRSCARHVGSPRR